MLKRELQAKIQSGHSLNLEGNRLGRLGVEGKTEPLLRYVIHL